MEKTKYKCAECGRGVLVSGDSVLRLCDHKDATIVAECSATCRGDSTFGNSEQKKQEEISH